jgi:hypothetical protein
VEGIFQAFDRVWLATRVAGYSVVVAIALYLVFAA